MSCNFQFLISSNFQILLSNIFILYQMTTATILFIRFSLAMPESVQIKFKMLGICCILNLFDMTAHLFNLIYRCEKVYEQRKNIVSVLDHIIVDKTFDSSTRGSLVELRGLVYSRSIRFTTANFYRLDYGLIIAFCSVVTTFTIILLQSWK
ncbi:hypothetical protein ABMA28_006028 [Loxostege sticticalis]|uniref:Gustatory receptor n=1 Tax=Loxostege sticticalis TaxID=481309 RepID=A0ABD0SJR6_LOXSC